MHNHHQKFDYYNYFSYDTFNILITSSIDIFVINKKQLDYIIKFIKTKSVIR
jgi:hypothetical protein